NYDKPCKSTRGMPGPGSRRAFATADASLPRRGRRRAAGADGVSARRSHTVRGNCGLPIGLWSCPVLRTILRRMDTTPSRRPPPPSPELVHLLEELRTARFALGRSCPRCGCERTHRWGSFSGRQRYRCLGCRRTFSDLTATPAAYSKKLLLWRDYGQCLAEGASVRHAARRVRVHPATAFRWRHALLGTLLECEASELLAGWVELCSLTLLYSEKGAAARRARRHTAAQAHRADRPERAGRPERAHGWRGSLPGCSSPATGAAAR